MCAQTAETVAATGCGARKKFAPTTRDIREWLFFPHPWIAGGLRETGTANYQNANEY